VQQSRQSVATAERLRDIARRWIEEGWQRGNPAVVDELHAVSFVDRSSGDRASGREGFREGIAQLYAAFFDFYAVIEDLIIDTAAGKVAVLWTATGTHTGPFMGLEPTGKRIHFEGIEVIRIEGDRIVERWGEWDGIGLLRQLGVLS
jgi:steroid delta-isomerase-like uncharacterized protein